MRNILIGATAAWLMLGAALAIVGAFLGAERASIFFNRPPLMGYWTGLTLLLLGWAVTLLLHRKIMPAIAHLGGTVILIGGFVGSDLSHRLWPGPAGPYRKGTMQLYPGESENRVLWETGRDSVVGTLNFSLTLEEWAGGHNKAVLRILGEKGDAGYGIVRVNHPLEFGGVHFYLARPEEGGSLLLSVVSRRGLWVVYAGFAWLMLGVLGSGLAPQKSPTAGEGVDGN